MSALADRLAARTLELVNIPSESRNEAEIAAHVRSLVPTSFELEYEGDDAFVWARPRSVERPLIVLAGHYDTVPAQENVPGRIENGTVVGLGASDMKGGLAVMLELALALERDGIEPVVDVALLAFGKEELPAEFSPLPDLFDRSRLVHEAELAILLEPTDNTIQAGCLGNLNAKLVFRGTSAHSARPWLGDNAIMRAVEGLAPLAALEPHDVEIEGLVFREVLSVTQINGGIATNVIPARAEAILNFRYAPDRTPEQAEARLRELVNGSGELELLGNSAPARVAAASPLVHALRDAGDFELEPKQAWTPVAEFSAQGLDAVNLGPGATRYAHTQDERVEIAALARTYAALERFGATL
jgi:succinyl-diaminopimelate desuccinylase